MDADRFERAGIGRNEVYSKNRFVRTDRDCWITGNTETGKRWLDWTSGLQAYLNRRLFPGLFSL